jgi:zinc transport system substrate-binding protein
MGEAIMKVIRETLIAAALSAVVIPQALGAQNLSVVVSLKPIHSLVTGVMGETGKPLLMLQGAASPHTYQMRPSEARALNQADLIVWIGKAMETFLDRPIANLGPQAEVLTLHEVSGIRMLRNRKAGIWEDDDHEEIHVDEHEDHDHDHGEFNTHVWLAPDNARRIVDVVADTLIRIDPGRAETYRVNAAEMRKRISALDSSLREHLSPVRRRAFVVFHDAYQYFERAYGLNSKGAVAVDPARMPSAKRLVELRNALAEHNVRCIFTEPQFEPDLVRTMVEGTNIRTAVLDPVGADTEPGSAAWFGIMQGLGDSMIRCLGGSRPLPEATETPAGG